MTQTGQINRGSVAGEFIYQLCAKTENKIIVEIGSWNGRGSTRCVMDALIARFDDCRFYSLEAHPGMYEDAQRYWNTELLTYNTMVRDRLNLIHGRIINEEEMTPLEEVLQSRHANQERWPQFYQYDVDSFRSCPNVLDALPEKIDVLILDGGEFTTYAEYLLLKDRTRVLVCDDSSKYKCEKIREELLADESYETLIDAPTQRNGFCAFARK